MNNKVSTSPLGATSYKETAFGITPRSKLLEMELEGTKKGLELVHKLVSDSGVVVITPELILKQHRESFGWIFPDWAGKYRKICVEFSGKEAILPHQIPEKIVNLCADLQEQLKNLDKNSDDYIEKVVELLAWFQHGFVLIHPFQDYNGRVARMLTILILLTLNLPPIEIKAENGNDRKKYLQAMYAADEGDYSKLEALLSKELAKSLAKSTK